jgi:hypothetical protein
MVSVNSYGRRGVGSNCFAAHGESSHSNVSSAVSEPQPPSIIGHKGPQQVLVSNSSPISIELVSPEGRALASFNSQLTDKQQEPHPNFGDFYTDNRSLFSQNVEPKYALPDKFSLEHSGTEENLENSNAFQPSQTSQLFMGREKEDSISLTSHNSLILEQSGNSNVLNVAR